MSMAPTPNAYHQADAQLLAQPGPAKDPHPQWRWNRRCPRRPRDWRGYNVQAAWREGTPIPVHLVGRDGYARIHPPSGMVLVASLGFLETAMHLRDVPPENRHKITDYLEDTDQ